MAIRAILQNVLVSQLSHCGESGRKEKPRRRNYVKLAHLFSSGQWTFSSQGLVVAPCSWVVLPSAQGSSCIFCLVSVRLASWTIRGADMEKGCRWFCSCFEFAASVLYALGGRGFLLFFPSSVVLYAFREKEYAFWSVVHSKHTHLTKIC